MLDRSVLIQQLADLSVEEEQIQQELQAHLAVLVGKPPLDHAPPPPYAAPFTATVTPDLDRFTGTASSVSLLTALQQIQQSDAVFETVRQHADKLAAQVDDCSLLSERLNSLVRRLDLKQTHAQQALACTEDILHLKECKFSLIDAIDAKDLIHAVGILRKIHEIDERITRSSEDFELIKARERDVTQLVREEFLNAIAGADIERVKSLCPLLQTLNLETEARDRLLEFMERSVFIGVTADGSGAVDDAVDDAATAYAQTLSGVFNAAYLVIQQYLPMVIEGLENSLGDVLFLRKLHARCESEASIVLKRYMKYRGVKEMIAAIRASPSPSPSASVSLSTAAGAVSLAEVHVVMDELALLIQFCCKYSAYLKHVCHGAESKVRAKNTTTAGVEKQPNGSIPSTTAGVEVDKKHPNGSATTAVVEHDRKHPNGSTSSTTAVAAATPAVVVVFPQGFEFDRMVDELVNKFYLTGETWLLRHGVAHSLPRDLLQQGTHSLDECFFVLHKCGMRGIATHNIHAACAVLAVIADCVACDLLAQAQAMLDNAVHRVVSALQEHMQRYRRSLQSGGGDEHGGERDRGGNALLVKGFSSAISSLTGGGGGASSLDAASQGGILFHASGGFTLSGASSTDEEDPWATARSLDAFNVMELCMRYTERLNKDLSLAAQSVFDMDDTAHKADNTQRHKKDHKSSVGKGGKTLLAAIASSTSDADRIKVCQDNFENAKTLFATTLRQGMDKIMNSVQSVMKDMLLFTLGRNAIGGGVRFNDRAEMFDQQDILVLLPKIVTLPLETMVGMLCAGLSEKNKDVMVGALADVCCEKFEQFINQNTFSLAGAMKLDEIVRSVSTLFGRHASVSIRSKFSRLRDIVMVLTAESHSAAIEDSFATLTVREVEAFLALRVDCS